MSAFIHGSNTSDIRLVAGIGAMGILCDEKNASGAISSNSRTDRVWMLAKDSDCGRWKLSDLIAWWKDRNFHLLNSDHPFNWVKCAMGSGKTLAMAFKSGDAVTQERRGNCLVFIVDPSQPQRPIAARGQFLTGDKRLLSALSSAAFRCIEYDCGTDRRMFGPAATSEFGKPLWEFMGYWNDVNFERSNPHANFAYTKSSVLNYEIILSGVKRDKPLQTIRQGDSFAYLHPDCSVETEAEIMSQFDK